MTSSAAAVSHFAHHSTHRLPFLTRMLTFAGGAYGLALLVYLLLRAALGDSLWWLAFLHNFTPYYFAPLLGVIPLLFVAGTKKMAFRLLPLLLIGALLYGPLWLPRSIVAAEDDHTLKVVTFNVLILTENFDTMEAWLRTTGADVVLLQETGGLDTAQVIDTMSDVYPYAVDLEGTTVMALSRYPVLEMTLVDLGSWFIDRFVLDVHGEALAVYNVHMTMPTRKDSHSMSDPHGGLLDLFLQYDETHRNQLIRNLLALLAEENLPYIVAGDFNTSDNAVLYGEMAAVLNDSYRETNIGLGATWPAAMGDDPLPEFIPPMLRIDYVWHSDDLRALSTAIGPNLGSDHLPVVATLALP